MKAFNHYFIQFFIGMLLCLLISGCRQNESSTKETALSQVVVRMFDEPETLSPILAQTSLAREAYQYIFLSLADYDFQTLEIKPVLIEEVPIGQLVTDGEYAGLMSYSMKIRDEAVWLDGSDVSGEDVLFTYKIALHPSVQSPAWKSFLNDIVYVETDATNPKNFTVFADDNHFLNKEIILSAQVYPHHFFDPVGVLKNVTLEELKDEAKLSELLNDDDFVQVGTDFSSVKFSKEQVEGAGPYHVESWETGRFLVLKQKENYWGESIEDIDQLKSYPDRIILQFIKDEATALTLLKNDEIDLMDLTRSTFKIYDDLQEDPVFSAKYDFELAQLPRYYNLLMNNEDLRLSELPVRKAIGHLLDVDRMIAQIEGGYATRVNSYIHFSKPEYYKGLDFVDFDVAKANEILEEAGWRDTDGDDIRDKIINGRKENLSLRIHISGSNLSSSVSAIIKDGLAKGGINIEIVQKPNRATRTENLLPGDYELFISQTTQSSAKDDPYTTFHSSSIGSGGQNYMRYSSLVADNLTSTIRTTKDESERLKAYHDLQIQISRDIPVIYLYSPQLRIVSDKTINPVISSKRPGYFVNASE